MEKTNIWRIKMKLRGTLVFILFTFVLLSVIACEKSNEQAAQTPNKQTAVRSMNAQSDRQPAYNFTLMTLAGNPVELGDFKGKVLILDFWDTWCPPCKAEIPHFVDLYSQYNSQGLEILGVAFGRNGVSAVRDFISDYGINYQNALGNQEIVNGFGGFNSIPTTFVIDKQGHIYKKYTGYRDKSVFETDIKALLNS